MSGKKQREHYARWDAPSTELLIREIITNKDVRLKMKSLIDKHHLKIKTNSVHLKYGVVKELAQKIHLSKEESRAISIKMINIAKSFKNKVGLERLFIKGWNLADKISSQDAKKKLKNNSGSSAADLARAQSENRRQLESLLENINIKVHTFTRNLRHKKIQNGIKKDLPGFPGGPKSLRPTKSKIDINFAENGGDLEIRSSPEHPSQSLALELGNDQLSRISATDSPFAQGPTSPSSEPELPHRPSPSPHVPDSVEHQLVIIQQIMQELRRKEFPDDEKWTIEFIFEKHLLFLQKNAGDEPKLRDLNNSIILSLRNLRDRHTPA